jgi:lipid-A-disaccharide synthase
MILAGEASGDAHAAEFVDHIRQLNPDIYISGMGTTEMRKSGVEVFFDSSTIAVMGLIEVLKHWGDIRRAMLIVKKRLDETRPDLLILVDYPEFNLKMARHARGLGIKVLFYISPQVWAWRPRRIHKIGSLIDHMAVIFKFEKAYYERANIPVSFVGHPLVDKVVSTRPVDEIRQQMGLDQSSTVIGLFPGSRESEIDRLLPLMLASARHMSGLRPQLHFIVPVAAALDMNKIKRQCDQSGLDITVTRDNIYDLISCCDSIISCSGTVTLEIALLGVPMCIVYKMSGISYAVISRLITIPRIGLVNIVANKSAIQEFLQNDATIENVSREMIKTIDDNDYRKQIKSDLRFVSENLGEGGGSDKMARLVLSFL